MCTRCPLWHSGISILEPLIVCMHACVREFSGGCVITVAGSNFNVSSTAQLILTNDQLDIEATATPVCRFLTHIVLCFNIQLFLLAIVNYDNKITRQKDKTANNTEIKHHQTTRKNMQKERNMTITNSRLNRGNAEDVLL